MEERNCIPILGVCLHPTSYRGVLEQVLGWVQDGTSHYVCTANVHMLMEAYDSADFNEIINKADIVTPDGMPLVWIMRLKGSRGQGRVYGPSLMLRLLGASAREQIPVGFYGSSAEVLNLLVKKMQMAFPGLDVSFQLSPPYYELSPQEDLQIIEGIRRAGVKILFVGLGCPKQERWMAAHQGRLNCVMVGVGAAFDFHAGLKPQAPTWMQELGMEWFFRLLTEPRRLWSRYFLHNPRFIFLAVLDLLGWFR